jgi:hypothetical protein
MTRKPYPTFPYPSSNHLPGTASAPSDTPVADALAGVDAAQGNDAGQFGLGPVRELAALRDLAEAVRAELTRPSDSAAMAAEADRDARTMAPPVPGVTVNAGYTVRAVIHMHDAVPGLLAEWLVACENERGEWAAWHAYMQDGPQAGRLSYDGGHYFQHPAGTRVNRTDALADLAVRAGTVHAVAERIAATIEGNTYAAAEDKRMAARLRKYFTR